LFLEQLTSHIPFSAQAIRMYVHRGDLREGIHYFRKGRRLIFKLSAIYDWLEGRLPTEASSATEAFVADDIVPVRRRA
jgi:hypothetical protein